MQGRALFSKEKENFKKKKIETKKEKKKKKEKGNCALQNKSERKFGVMKKLSVFGAYAH